jgi:hypothetical protein
VALEDRSRFQNSKGHVQGHLKEGLSSLVIDIVFIPLVHGLFRDEDATSQAGLEPHHLLPQ